MDLLDKNIPMVSVRIKIGGDLPESRLDAFMAQAFLVYQQNTNQFTNQQRYKENIYKYILNQIDVLDNSPLELECEVPDGEVQGIFLIHCAIEELKVLTRIPPFVDHYGNYKNEALWLQDKQITVIPTDGETNPTTLVEDVFTVLDEILTELELPEDQLPLQINKVGVVNDVAKRRLSGEPLRKIITEVMHSRISYPSTELPPFKIIKGK